MTPSGGPVCEPVVVGRIGGAYGVQGWLRITSYTEPPGNLLDYRPWMVETAAGWQPMTPGEVRPHGAGFVARLREVASREQAQALAGRLIGVPREALPQIDAAEDAFYWRDLVGAEVWDSTGRRLGRVDHLIPTGGHDVLVVRDGDGEILIPFVGRFVTEVDVPGRRLVVDWDAVD